jgi:hypothetical protein
MNAFPGVDYRVFLDMQFHLMATDPVFEGLGGLSAWILRYADDETIRWLGRLYRHYAIEGRRDMLSEALGLTYHLTHLRNPGFVHGLAGWEANPAPSGGIEPRVVKGFGVARGTMHPSSLCDRVVAFKRTESCANRLSQPLRELQPGALYTVKMYTADGDGLQGAASQNPTHAVDIEVDGAQMLPDRYVREEYDRAYGGRRETGLKTWFNYHVWTFRAMADTARLTVMDAPSEHTAGQRRQHLLVSFIEVMRVAGDPAPGG